MPCLLSAMCAYAADHQGRFPSAGKTPYDSLLELHPTYIGSSPSILAGISGDKKMVSQKITTKKPITSNDCSWVYFPGLQFDSGTTNPIMIVYERQSGLQFNGAKAEIGSHVVGFNNGNFASITSENWTRFLKEQEALRDTIISSTTSPDK